MPAWRDQPEQAFNESCCDGGACVIDDRSAQPCGCDKGANHVCEWHATEAWREMIERSETKFGATIEKHNAKIEGIHDSGERMKFASGSMRDPSTGKIDWTRVTFGPMLRRWAKHLTTAEAKYPDAALGVPNFSLIETEEEYLRYKKSAYRHFMSWFYNETDEDHASAVFFNINGVEIIKAKRRGETLQTMKDSELFKEGQ